VSGGKIEWRVDAIDWLRVSTDHQVKLNHGTSKPHPGKRQTAGMIFHDAV
jgi:hypothetical protein